ncbi:MAG: hypothetical protein GX117_03620 [Candidatus Hydrogenedentes bacterium]|nr:hypothetical protein [Candidatus Hydrogenedentota bacterium]
MALQCLKALLAPWIDPPVTRWTLISFARLVDGLIQVDAACAVPVARKAEVAIPWVGATHIFSGLNRENTEPGKFFRGVFRVCLEFEAGAIRQKFIQ